MHPPVNHRVRHRRSLHLYPQCSLLCFLLRSPVVNPRVCLLLVPRINQQVYRQFNLLVHLVHNPAGNPLLIQALSQLLNPVGSPLVNLLLNRRVPHQPSPQVYQQNNLVNSRLGSHRASHLRIRLCSRL